MHQPNVYWDVNLIRSIFPPFVANAIVQLPLLPKGWGDKFVWISTKNGLYSLKSGYYLAVILFDSTVGAGSYDFQGSSSFCCQFWNFNLSKKVKNFE